jgi:CHASE3 domain sensor protein
MDTNEPVKPAHPMLLKKMTEIRLLIADLKGNMNHFLLTGNLLYDLPYPQMIEEISIQIEEIKALLEKESSNQLQYIQKTEALFKNWHEAAISKAEVRKELETLIDKGPGVKIMASLENEFETFIDSRNNIFTFQCQDYMKKESDMIRIVGAGSGIAVMFALLISFFLARSIAQTGQSRKGSYVTGYEMRKEDEIHQVAYAINNSVGELTKIAVLLQEISDELKRKSQKWEMGEGWDEG